MNEKKPRTKSEAAHARIQAIRLRQTVKGHKPNFRRHESWRYKRLKESWRKPRGLDNKLRRRVKGWPKRVNIGYGGPKITRGLHPSGYEEVLVHTPDELAIVKPETQAIRIAHTVGMRKRIQIASDARERQIHVLNPLIRRKVEEEERIEDEVAEETASQHETSTSEEATAKTKKKTTRSRRPKRKRSEN